MKVNALRIAMISLITLQVAAQIKNLSFHGLAWAPNANITFVSQTLHIPNSDCMLTFYGSFKQR